MVDQAHMAAAGYAKLASAIKDLAHGWLLGKKRIDQMLKELGWTSAAAVAAERAAAERAAAEVERKAAGMALFFSL